MSEKKVLLMLAEGFEEVEAVTVVDLLRRADIDVQTVSITGRRIVDGTHGIPVTADIVFEDADFVNAEMIILPGGLPGTTNLLEYEPLTAQLKEFAAQKKPLAAICAAPMILAAHGILEGKKATIYSGMEENLAGAVRCPDKVVLDENIITSKGPGTAMNFALEIIRFLRSDEASEEVKNSLS